MVPLLQNQCHITTGQHRPLERLRMQFQIRRNLQLRRTRPIALNFTLLPDVCGVPGATVRSYRFLQNATCANGTTAEFNYYNSNNSTADPTAEDPNPGLAKRMKNRRQVAGNLDGECLALIAFNSLAFVWEGVAPGKKRSISLSTSASVPTTASSSTTPSISFPSNQSNTAISSSTTSSPATSSPITSNRGSKSSLSAGTSAGVGVGSAVGVLAIAALCFFYFQRQTVTNTKRGNRRSEPLSANAAMTSASDTGGIAYEAGVGQPHEIGGDAIDNVHEAGTDNEIHEIANQRMNLDL